MTWATWLVVGCTGTLFLAAVAVAVWAGVRALTAKRPSLPDSTEVN